MSIPEVSIEQVRAARALIRWQQADLAAASGVSLPTIKRLEASSGTLGARSATVTAIREAFEAQGVQFLEAGQVAAGSGVAFKEVGKKT